MKRVINILMIYLILFMILVMADSMCMAQSGNVFQFPTFTTQSLRVPTWSNPVEGGGDILVDNFEYWDSPLNHGWFQLEPPPYR